MVILPYSQTVQCMEPTRSKPITFLHSVVVPLKTRSENKTETPESTQSSGTYYLRKITVASVVREAWCDARYH